jgi:hypothetical protein
VRIPGGPIASAHRVNLLEEAGDALAVEDDAVVVPFRPWELVTVLVG